MNWMEVLVSGGIAAVLGGSQPHYVTERNWVKLVLFYRLLFLLSSGMLFITNIIILTGSTNNDRTQIEQSLESFPVFQTLKQQKLALYTQLIDNFIKSSNTDQYLNNN